MSWKIHEDSMINEKASGLDLEAINIDLIMVIYHEILNVFFAWDI